jgi:hypothetical protein
MFVKSACCKIGRYPAGPFRAANRHKRLFRETSYIVSRQDISGILAHRDEGGWEPFFASEVDSFDLDC